MIVELYGLAGSGKTYSTPRIAAQYGLPVADVSRRRERYACFLGFCRSHPALAGSLLLETVRRTLSRPSLLFHKLKMLVSNLAKVQKAVRLGGGVVDAGLFQFLLVIYEEAVSEAELAKFKDRLALQDYRILVFDVDDDVRTHRMTSRGPLPRGQFGEAYQRRWYDIYVSNDKVVRNFIARHFAPTPYRN